MDAEGSNPVNLSNNAASEQLPSWSPDGERIDLASDAAALVDVPDSRAWGASPSGSCIHQLPQSTSKERPVDPIRRVSTACLMLAGVAACGGDDPADPGTGSLEVTTVSAGEGTSSEAQEQLPAWSPDGDRTAFTSNRTGNYEVFVTDPDGLSPVNILNNPAYDSPGVQSWGP